VNPLGTTLNSIPPQIAGGQMTPQQWQQFLDRVQQQQGQQTPSQFTPPEKHYPTFGPMFHVGPAMYT
jgi:hypothetical protein